MMSGDVSIDLGSTLRYVEQRVLGLFGKDADSQEWARKIRDMIGMATQHAAYVQCVGMHKPIPIEQIYQPSRLRLPRGDNSAGIKAADLLDGVKGSIVFAGPGQGKTTFLHSIYTSLAKDKNRTPVLFTLRWEHATEELESFINRLSQQGDSKKRLVLLVDGYDEITVEERHVVSKALLLFQSLQRGPFLLTCRNFYDVYDVKCDRYEIEAFSQDDAVRFVEAFCGIYEVQLNADSLITELIGRGFNDFITHPLMLTLVCILKTGPNQEIPRRAIGLIRRAIEVLTFRWDQEKRVARKSYVPLDGEERVRCLMRIAFFMKSHQASYEELLQIVNDHLALVQLSKVEPAKLLDELAQWYGIVVPVEHSRWQFVHRTIHDFLAARFWVESGMFSAGLPKEWNVRAAYAVCLLPDATAMLLRMLSDAESLEAFSECLYNKAPFDNSEVAEAVIQRAWRRRISVVETEDAIHVFYDENPCAQAGPDFLRKLVAKAAHWGAEQYNGSSVACLALAEMKRKAIKIDRHHISGRLGDLIPANPIVTINGASAFRLQEAIN